MEGERGWKAARIYFVGECHPRNSKGSETDTTTSTPQSEH